MVHQGIDINFLDLTLACKTTLAWLYYHDDVAICIERGCLSFESTQLKIWWVQLWSNFLQHWCRPIQSCNTSCVWITLFCLDSRLQSGFAGPPKWEPRSRLASILSCWFCRTGTKSKDRSCLFPVLHGFWRLIHDGFIHEKKQGSTKLDRACWKVIWAHDWWRL